MIRSSSHPIVLGVTLALIAGLSAAIMAFANVMTNEPIRKSAEQRRLESFRCILPEFDNDIAKTAQTVSVEGVPVVFYTASKNGKITAYAAEVSASGYGGKISGLIGFDTEGRILSYVITSHSETPGLGSRVTDRVRSRTISDLFHPKAETGLVPNAILDSFRGHSASEKDRWKQPWRIRKDGGRVKHVSGATVSSRAVTGMAWNAAAAFREFQKQKEGK